MKIKKNLEEIKDYDHFDTALWINTKDSLRFEDLGLKLPSTPPTQVVSIRLPSELLNEIKALGSKRDVPYQSLIKLFLAQAVLKFKKRMA